LPWKRGDLPKAMMRIWPAVLLAFCAGAVAFALRSDGPIIAPFAIALAFWAIFGVLADLGERVKLGRAPASETIRRLVNLPRSAWGQAVAHTGFGLTAFGVAAVTAWNAEDIRTAQKGDLIPIAGYEIRFDGVTRERGPNFRVDVGRFTIMVDGVAVDTVASEKRFYPVQRANTTEAGIRASLIEDVYVSLGDKQTDGSWAVRSYVKPFANWIWLGALIMTLGGMLSLSDRRHRVGAPTRAKRQPMVAAE
jgi:cytochrome c-type biogenesis protein CcmF